MTPESIIADTIRFDHRPSENARRIIAQLADHGYRITDQQSSLPEITSAYSKPVG